MSNVLIVDDEQILSKNIAKFLDKSGHDVRTAFNAIDGIRDFTESPPDVIIIDYNLPDMDGLQVISKIREVDPEVAIIMITGHGSIALAVDAMKIGANDLMTKPIVMVELRERINHQLNRQRDTTRLKYYENKNRNYDSLDEIKGNSEAIINLKRRISKIANIETEDNYPPILITGETGTGKELIARACHFCSSRSDKPFVEINCAAIPENLLESELLGHERGAFTDAKDRKIGLFEAADGGTLFLDEFGELPLLLQAKLLKVIEDGRFRRLGSTQERSVNIQIITATNQDLEENIRQGLLRADLYFRLSVLKISSPPLRERESDQILLAKHFLELFSKRYRKVGLNFTDNAVKLIALHSWPGNVRELRNVVEQAVLLSEGTDISSNDLMLHPMTHNQEVEQPSYQTNIFSNKNENDESVIARAERDLLIEALKQTNGNVTKAALILKISRDTLRYRIEKYELNTICLLNQKSVN